METKEYIASGILELYVYGLLSEAENIEIAEKAKQIKLKKKIDGLVVDKNNEFLSALSPEEIKSLNLERVKQYKTLSKHSRIDDR